MCAAPAPAPAAGTTDVAELRAATGRVVGACILAIAVKDEVLAVHLKQRRVQARRPTCQLRLVLEADLETGGFFGLEVRVALHQRIGGGLPPVELLCRGRAKARGDRRMQRGGSVQRMGQAQAVAAHIEVLALGHRAVAVACHRQGVEADADAVMAQVEGGRGFFAQADLGLAVERLCVLGSEVVAHHHARRCHRARGTRAVAVERGGVVQERVALELQSPIRAS